MSELDAYYTPPEIADVVAGAFPNRANGVYVDPAAGGGSLLLALKRRFPSATLWGMDIDAAAVSALRRRSWVDTASRADFLSARSVSSSGVGRSRAKVTGVVLNPPFSYRGGSASTVRLGERSWVLPIALRFLARSLDQFTPADGVAAILPLGSYLGEKYQSFWGHVRETYTVEELARPSNAAFAGTRASSVIVRLQPGAFPSTESVVPEARHQGCVEVVRGRVQIHALKKNGSLSQRGGVRFVHTSDLARRVSTRAPATVQHVQVGRLRTQGPMVVVPRVGNPGSFRPIVVDQSVVLSDCVLALRPIGELSVSSIVSILEREWPLFGEKYTGTGARYITVGSVLRFLGDLGFHGMHVRADSRAGLCGAAHPLL
ncbi:methyltransferase [Curtobacterium sp. DN_7.5]|uniref:methyltransferase n=1 Tax=Curtobacterium sp. DN_7.5 TaxID=3049047 RepID=UPI003313B422